MLLQARAHQTSRSQHFIMPATISQARGPLCKTSTMLLMAPTGHWMGSFRISWVPWQQLHQPYYSCSLTQVQQQHRRKPSTCRVCMVTAPMASVVASSWNSMALALRSTSGSHQIPPTAHGEHRTLCDKCSLGLSDTSAAISTCIISLVWTTLSGQWDHSCDSL